MRKNQKHTEKSKAKISQTHKGKSLSESHKKKLSDIAKNMSEKTKKLIGMASRKRWADKKYREKTGEAISKGLMGHTTSDEIKKKISISETGKTIPQYIRLTMNKDRAGVPLSAEHRKKISESTKGKKISDSRLKQISITTKALWSTQEYRDKQLTALKRTRNQRALSVKRHWEDENYKNAVVFSMRKSMAVKPNNAELKLNQLLQQSCPNEYKYVGDGQFILAGKNPDFININGKKEIIELFGDYWHSEKITGECKNKHELDRITLFNSYGYKTLIIWENELKNIRKLQKKIIDFRRCCIEAKIRVENEKCVMGEW